ncbi:MAG: hypothetical protein CMI04_11230 [Oceanospirillaceae bacterium]|nr:hypothetical protein [Oceanospirillaceae bacterium]
MRYFYLVVDGFGPIAGHMEEVAKGLLCDYIYDQGYEVSDCFIAFEAGTNETAAKIYLEAFRHMRTCLYGEFQDSEYFDVVRVVSSITVLNLKVSFKDRSFHLPGPR